MICKNIYYLLLFSIFYKFKTVKMHLLKQKIRNLNSLEILTHFCFEEYNLNF